MKNTIKVDDPDILDMDPVQKRWLYENWLADQKDTAEIAKNHAYLVGSFWNPEAVKDLIDDKNQHSSTEEEYEESIKMVMEAGKNQQNNSDGVRKRRRRKLQG